jgi:hypothetical protein
MTSSVYFPDHHILIDYDRIKVEEHFSHATKEKLETKIRIC